MGPGTSETGLFATCCLQHSHLRQPAHLRQHSVGKAPSTWASTMMPSSWSGPWGSGLVLCLGALGFVCWAFHQIYTLVRCVKSYEVKIP